MTYTSYLQGLLLAGAFQTAAHAQTVVEDFEYPGADELALAWAGSGNAVVSPSTNVAPQSTGMKALRVEFGFPSVAFATETVTGPVLETPVVIGAEQYVSFRVKGDPAFRTADFRNLYLYAYDAEGNFGRWGAAVPTTGSWQVFNFAASAVEKPWDSPALPDLGQIVKFAFFQYGSESAIPAYSAAVELDDVTVRDTPLSEPPPTTETMVETFEYAGTAELAAAWQGSANATVTASGDVSPGSPGTNAMRVAFSFPSVAFATETVTGPVLAAPVGIAPAQYVSFRVKGDPVFAAADFRHLYLYAYDAAGNFGRWGAPVPVTADWQAFNFQADTIGKPWDSPALPDLGRIVKFAFFQYGSEAAIPAYAAAILVDDLEVRDTPLTNPVPPQEFVVDAFEYDGDEALQAVWTETANALALVSDDVSPRSAGRKAMQVEFNFPSGEWVTESVSGPLLGTPVSIGAAQYLTFRIKGDPAFAAADFRQLYLYVYDTEGNFGRWGAAVPDTADWKVFNFSVAAIEQPWNSPALPDLGQIVRFAFFQYGSQAALPEYAAVILVDDLEVRNAPLTEFPLPSAPRVLIEDFEGYADAAALTGFYSYQNSPAATATTASLETPAPQGGKALKLAVDFAPGQYPWGSVRSGTVAPFSLPTNAVVSLRFKGDPGLAPVADGGTAFWLSFYDTAGRPIHYVTPPAPVTAGEWTTLEAGLAAFGDPAAVDIGNLVGWRILVQGWEGTALNEAQSGAFYVDDIRITVPAGLQVSGNPPAGLTGAAFTDITVDEAGKVISAALPIMGSHGFLTITPAQDIQSMAVENGRLVIRW